jgi:hypothetical protein
MATLREALESAMSEGGEEDAAAAPAAVVDDAPVAAPLETAPEVETAEVAPDATVEKGRDEAGRFAKGVNEGTKKPEAPKLGKAVVASPKEAAAATQPLQPATHVTPATPAAALKPPQSWKASVREKWATLPAEVQGEILRREKEIATGMQESSEHRKTAEEFRKLVGPYEGLMRAHGVEPLKLISTYLNTEAALRTAQPEHRAEIFSRLVGSYGVPPEALVTSLVRSGVTTIEKLDEALSAGVGQPRPSAPPDYRDPRVDQLIAMAQHRQQAQSQRESHEVQFELSAFGEAHEFFEQVRGRMAALMGGGVARTLEEAYNEACWADPDVRATVQQREKAKAAENAQASTQRARAATASVKSQPAGSVASPQPKTLREQLEVAASAVSGGR